MARKNRSPEENARRAKIRELLQESNISSMADIQNLFKETIAEFMENGLEAELDDELGYSKYDYKNKETENCRNGHSTKQLKTSFGNVEVSIPRDRQGEFEPKLLKKNQNSVSQDVEEKILSMYAKGMTVGDIETHIQDIYGLEVSDTTISRITDKILPIVREWQQRPLESVYAVVFLDAIHYHVRSEGQIVKKAVYIAIGTDLDGRKDVLGMWVGENESAKFWATVLNGLRNRGVQDIFIACTDNLTGFSAAINAVFPKTDIQNCIIHQLRNSSKYVSYGEIDNSIDNLWSVLFTTGYLTQAGKAERGVYKLIIPNKEVREVFVLQIQEWFKKTFVQDEKPMQVFCQAFLDGNAEEIQKRLTIILGKMISVMDTKAPDGQKENFYHGLLLGLLRSDPTWLIQSNAESGDGFSDILIEPEDPDSGIVIEVKYASSVSALDQACQQAMEQIHERRYDERLRNDARENILAYEIAFSKKRCRVVSEKLC